VVPGVTLVWLVDKGYPQDNPFLFIRAILLCDKRILRPQSFQIRGHFLIALAAV